MGDLMRQTGAFSNKVRSLRAGLQRALKLPAKELFPSLSHTEERFGVEKTDGRLRVGPLRWARNVLASELVLSCSVRHRAPRRLRAAPHGVCERGHRAHDPGGVHF